MHLVLVIEEKTQSQSSFKAMGHAKEIITLDVYADYKGIISDGVPEMETYMQEVLLKKEDKSDFIIELLEIEIDVSEYLSG